VLDFSIECPDCEDETGIINFDSKVNDIYSIAEKKFFN
jgi:hypothetical protein